jgi:phosphoribosyl 1,2-cyclic phosphate phosphodiesterase
MKITFLGTGTSQGVPVIACKCEVCLSKNLKDKRLRSSVLIEFQNKTIVIDTGPDFRQQMLRESVEKLDAVLFTHAHKDHVAGLDDIRSFNFRSKKPMDIYCTNDVLNALRMEYSYIFSEKTYPGVPKVNVNIIENNNFYIDDIEIQPIKALHYKLPVLGFRIKNFIYLTDLSEINSTEKRKMINADVIVLDSLRKEPHLSHLSLR